MGKGNEGYWRETAPAAGLLRALETDGVCRFTEANERGEGYYGEIKTVDGAAPRFTRTVRPSDYTGMDYGVEALARTLLAVLKGEAPPPHHVNSGVRQTSGTGTAINQPDWASEP